MTYRPFNLEEALKGAKVVAVDKLDTTITQVAEVAQFKSGELAVRLTTGALWTFDQNGDSWSCRLMMAPKPKRKVKLWVNIYRDSTGSPYGFVHGSPEEAERIGAKAPVERIALVQTEEFEVEEP